VTLNIVAPSIGLEIVYLANRNTTGVDTNLAPIPEDNDSMETEEDMSESVCEEIDDMLDEALDDSRDDGSVLMSPKKQKEGSTSSSGSNAMTRCESSSSWEFHTPQPNKARDPEASRFKTPLVLMDKSPTHRTGRQVEDPVTHTVSFYRKQRPVHVTPVQRIILNPVLEQTMVENAPSPRATISQKIKILQSEAESQMSIITQASNALSLCRSTKEFYGSAEQVEGERLLLEATHKHNAALKEISRLKTEGGLGADPDRDTSVRGTVCINSISLKLKKEFIEQLKSGESDDLVHYFLCLVKCAGQVIPTQMLSTLHGLDSKTLDFPNLIRLTELPKNFSIQLEVYGLQTMRESLDHETKYHIKKDKTGLFGLTPKLLMGKHESRLTRPDVGSPKASLAVRTSSFKVVGNTTITIDNLKRKEWRLDSVPHVSPLEGCIAFQLNCYSESQVKFRGFLTMFDDVSGYGAWHRRWFVLEGNRLSYWKYPESQKTQEPIGSIDLGGCITENVHIAPREICSRFNTCLLESRRPAKSSDRESLVLVRQGTHTIIRHLLSADSREERVEWCAILNQALDNLRAWDPKEETRSETSSSIGSDSTVASSTSTDIW
jgi:actin-binding protein anillin